MARKDQIITAGSLYVGANWETNVPNVLIECFEKGADWADEHPAPYRFNVTIRKSGEDGAAIVREMTKEEYELLSDIVQELGFDVEMTLQD